eukprot:TRINITY_DN3247_c0_g1_i1.p1 TRINITY_DN3247_c0_g1~~TRINITY_DN3247_c0_g1_i1.p1  ORF type:complete len:122 (-),score=16.62 TRINITY_DN3247_c0_g1_i1:78-443(-)
MLSRFVNATLVKQVRCKRVNRAGLETPYLATKQRRLYSQISMDEAKERIFKVLRSYNRVKDTPIKEDTHFRNDLHLDSLDATELVLALEEEFAILIPDKDADKINTVNGVIEYISKHPQAR